MRPAIGPAASHDTVLENHGLPQHEPAVRKSPNAKIRAALAGASTEQIRPREAR
jgi:hypothetical protein